MSPGACATPSFSPHSSPSPCPQNLYPCGSIKSSFFALLFKWVYCLGALPRWSVMSVVKKIWPFQCTWPCVHCSQVIFFWAAVFLARCLLWSEMVSGKEKYKKHCFHCKKIRLIKKLNQTSPHICWITKLQCMGIGTPGLLGLGGRQMLS